MPKNTQILAWSCNMKKTKRIEKTIITLKKYEAKMHKHRRIVLCTLCRAEYHLTLNKIYETEICLDTKTFDYSITNDIGIRHGLEKSLFINISEKFIFNI